MSEENGRTELEAKLAQKETEIAELKEKQETNEKRITDSQEMINKQSGEIGDDRKAIKDGAEAILKLNKDMSDAYAEKSDLASEKAQLQNEVAELKKQVPTEEDGNKKKEALATEIADLESSLSDDEKTLLDEALEKADAETKSKIGSDNETYRDFLLEMKKSTGTSTSPPNRWRATPAPKSEELSSGNDLGKLFETKKESARFVPDGSKSGAPRVKSDHKRLPEGKKNADWVEEG